MWKYTCRPQAQINKMASKLWHIAILNNFAGMGSTFAIWNINNHLRATLNLINGMKICAKQSCVQDIFYMFININAIITY